MNAHDITVSVDAFVTVSKGTSDLPSASSCRWVVSSSVDNTSLPVQVAQTAAPALAV